MVWGCIWHIRRSGQEARIQFLGSASLEFIQSLKAATAASVEANHQNSCLYVYPSISSITIRALSNVNEIIRALFFSSRVIQR